MSHPVRFSGTNASAVTSYGGTWSVRGLDERGRGIRGGSEGHGKLWHSLEYSEELELRRPEGYFKGQGSRKG